MLLQTKPKSHGAGCPGGAAPPAAHRGEERSTPGQSGTIAECQRSGAGVGGRLFGKCFFFVLLGGGGSGFVVLFFKVLDGFGVFFVCFGLGCCPGFACLGLFFNFCDLLKYLLTG